MHVFPKSLREVVPTRGRLVFWARRRKLHLFLFHTMIKEEKPLLFDIGWLRFHFVHLD